MEPFLFYKTILSNLDVGDSRSHAKAVEYVKDLVAENGLNVLFNNAGVGGKSVRLPAVKEEDILKTFSINAMTPVMLSKVSSMIHEEDMLIRKILSRQCILS